MIIHYYSEIKIKRSAHVLRSIRFRKGKKDWDVCLKFKEFKYSKIYIINYTPFVTASKSHTQVNDLFKITSKNKFLIRSL